jgi:membrane protein implicated in regulation of membrane protease activity
LFYTRYLRRRKISDLSDKLNDIKRTIRNAYFEYINPKLGKVREKISNFGILTFFTLPVDLQMWFGIAAGITGLFLLLDSTMYWYWQLLLMLFIIFVGPFLLQLGRSLYHGADNVLAVYPGKQLIGQNITLKKAIIKGSGEAVLQGESWQVQGNDLSAGTRVKVIAVKKNILYVVSAMQAFDKDV